MAVEYIDSPDLEIIAKKLIELYSAYIGYVDLGGIYFAMKVTDKIPARAKAVEVKGLSSDWAKKLLLQTPTSSKLYCISAFDELWHEMPEAHREWAVFQCLYTIGTENDGKLRKPDISGFGFMLTYCAQEGLPLDWAAAASLPRLTGHDPVPFPLPPSEDDDTTGSTL